MIEKVNISQVMNQCQIVTDADYVFVEEGNSQGKMKLSVFDSLSEGVFIMFHRKSDNYPLMVKPDKWASYQSSGEIAEGVVVVEGGKILVVAPTETSLHWSSAAVSGGGKTTTDRLTALDDWTGKASTTAQITHAECSSASYAPGYCAQYSRVNANGKGLTAGRWWLPSLGELMMIYANMRKINYALSLIEGATQLSGNVALEFYRVQRGQRVGFVPHQRQREQRRYRRRRHEQSSPRFSIFILVVLWNITL